MIVVAAGLAAVAVLLTLWIRKRASGKTPPPPRITPLWRIKRAVAFAATLLPVFACVWLAVYFSSRIIVIFFGDYF